MPKTAVNTTTNHGQEFIEVAAMWMEFHTCGGCGVTFGVPKTFIEQRRKDGKGWSCPNGHTWYFSGESEAEKLQRQLAAEREHTARLTAHNDQLQASVRGERAAKTRIRNERDRLKQRGAAGVCPHPDCHRHFANLERHVAAKHPELLEEVRSTP